MPDPTRQERFDAHKALPGAVVIVYQGTGRPLRIDGIDRLQVGDTVEVAYAVVDGRRVAVANDPVRRKTIYLVFHTTTLELWDTDQDVDAMDQLQQIMVGDNVVSVRVTNPRSQTMMKVVYPPGDQAIIDNIVVAPGLVLESSETPPARLSNPEWN